MSSMLVHIHTGPADANKATLGLLVALTAATEGHDVTVFLAGDGVHLLAPAYRELEGEGTGVVGEHLARHGAKGTRFLVSGKSAKARGYDEALLEGLNAEFAMPEKLVELAAASGTVLCY
ncbi:DsrE family protein [Psychromarinibacter sp. C21-152]|uniref:DsrE family protein n=1 Tax=Psychromarinibacter sediminicola TaxID=3033385 RepID=A0AAE3NYA2_9RHOB|nr:DsrE family protein [Psychromarinibacter sediminicola]MDF0602882.1 DsrE family protein [Psychromarinibacter sediminicola]